MNEYQREDGRWLPLEPMPEPFGIVWQRFRILRRRRGEGWLRSLLRSWADARAVTRPPAARQPHPCGTTAE